MATEADIGTSWAGIATVPIAADYAGVARSSVDTRVTSEAVARRNVLGRPSPDTRVLTDAGVRRNNNLRLTPDTRVLADLSAATATRPRSILDALALSDGVFRDYDPRRLAADSVARSDALLRDYNPLRTVTDQWSTGAAPSADALFPDFVRAATHLSGPVSIVLTGAAGSFASTPAKSDFNITDLDLRFEGSVDSWEIPIGSSNQAYLVSNYGHLVSGFKLYLSSASTNLRFQFGPTAASALVTNPFANGRRVRIRLTRTASDGVTKFFGSANLSLDWLSLPQIGSSQVVSAGQTIPAGSVSLKIGSGEGAAALAGAVGLVEVRDGANVVASFDASTVQPTGSRAPSTLRGGADELWTMTGAGWRWSNLLDLIRDGPDADDGLFLVDDGTPGDLRVSFPLPAGNLVTGAGLQEFRIRVQPG